MAPVTRKSSSNKELISELENNENMKISDIAEKPVLGDKISLLSATSGITSGIGDKSSNENQRPIASKGSFLLVLSSFGSIHVQII